VERRPARPPAPGLPSNDPGHPPCPLPVRLRAPSPTPAIPRPHNLMRRPAALGGAVPLPHCNHCWPAPHPRVAARGLLLLGVRGKGGGCAAQPAGAWPRPIQEQVVARAPMRPALESHSQGVLYRQLYRTPWGAHPSSAPLPASHQLWRTTGLITSGSLTGWRRAAGAGTSAGAPAQRSAAAAGAEGGRATSRQPVCTPVFKIEQSRP
jgi:hypothetical protein